MLRDDDIEVSEGVIVHVKSVADWSRPEVLGAIGDVLDAFPELTPGYWGKGDPPEHQLVAPFGDVLRERAPSFVDNDQNFIQTVRLSDATGPQVLGRIRGEVVRSGVPPRRGWSCVLGHAHDHIELDITQSWFEGPEAAARLDRLVDAFGRLCDAADAFQGWIDTSQLSRQRHELRSKGYSSGAIPSWRSDPKAVHLPDAHELPDVFWVQFFGPSFVEHWGTEKVERLGIRRQHTGSGGVVVWATDTPFSHDPDATRMDDYQWKHPFYEVLGNDAVLHEGFIRQPPGTLVPSYEDHVRHLRG